MTKAISNLEICFIKSVLLSCEHRHFLQNFTSHGVNSPPPQILLGLSSVSMGWVVNINDFKVKIILSSSATSIFKMGTCVIYRVKFGSGRILTRIRNSGVESWASPYRLSAQQDFCNFVTMQPYPNNGIYSPLKQRTYFVSQDGIKVQDLISQIDIQRGRERERVS